MSEQRPADLAAPDSTPTYSVVVPVYNSVESLSELVERLKRVFEQDIRDTFEIVMVDDASPNRATWPELERLSAIHPEVVAIQLMRNFGKHGALICAFEHARGRWIVALDDDLQHRPEDIPILLAEREHDLVFGAFRQKHHSAFKRVASRIKGYFDYKLAGKPRHIFTSPFMLIRREVIDAVVSMRTPHPFVAALLFFVTRDVVNVFVSHDPRKYGKSEFTLRKMVAVFSILILHNSSFLLNIVVITGFGVAVLSFAFGAFVVISQVIDGATVQGWASLMTMQSLLGGLVLVSLGVIGEYLLRILVAVEGRPPHIVRRATRKAGLEPSRAR